MRGSHHESHESDKGFFIRKIREIRGSFSPGSLFPCFSCLPWSNGASPRGSRGAIMRGDRRSVSRRRRSLFPLALDLLRDLGGLRGSLTSLSLIRVHLCSFVA